MTLDMVIVLIVLCGAIVLFMIDKVPIDLTAMIIMAALLLTGIITPEEGIAGFSNTATVTVAAMFVLSAALFQTGALNFVGDFLKDSLSKNFWTGMLFLMLIISVISAFINVTAVVALFMPVLIGVSKDAKISASKLLIPLSYSALLGGVGTLIGTSTNILVSSIAYKHGMHAFDMFEMTPFGIVVLVVGIIYLLTIGIRLLPDRDSMTGLIKKYEMTDYITEIILLPNAESVEKQIQESPLVNDLDIDIIEIRRGDNYRFFPSSGTVLKSNDILKVRTDIDKLKHLQQREGIMIRPKKENGNNNLNLAEAALVEAVVTHNSRLKGRTIKGINFRETYGATVLAIKHRGQLMHEKLGRARIRSGDVLLIEVKKDWLTRLRQNQDFIVVSDVTKTEVDKGKILTAVLILFGVVGTAALGIFPIVQSAVIGSVLMVLTRCISLDEAYKAINWKVIFLLAGVLTLGLALEKTGGASLISSAIINLVGGLGNKALVSAFFFFTLVFTNFMSNNATAALFAPIAILTAQSLGLNPRPFLMAVTFAASLSFMTPVGYQTNMMVMGPGNYKFKDYLKVGAPLDLILWILATLLIPVFYPL